MEPKTIITALCITLFIASIVIIAQMIWSNKEIGFLRNVIYKLNEENSRLNVELDIAAEQRNKQSKRIAELIELCDKLQPDLVGRQEIKVDIDCDIKGINDFVFKTREQLNAWYLDKGLESVNRINEDAWKAMPGLNSTRSDQLIYSAIDDQIKNLMFRNIVDNASKLDVGLNEEFYNSQKQK